MNAEAVYALAIVALVVLFILNGRQRLLELASMNSATAERMRSISVQTDRLLASAAALAAEVVELGARNAANLAMLKGVPPHQADPKTFAPAGVSWDAPERVMEAEKAVRSSEEEEFERQQELDLETGRRFNKVPDEDALAAAEKRVRQMAMIDEPEEEQG